MGGSLAGVKKNGGPNKSVSAIDHRQPPPLIKLFVLLILTAGTLAQGAKLLRGVSVDVQRVIENIGQSAKWRGAKYNQGQRFADYVIFLVEHIPQHGRVVLPPADVRPKELGNTPYMQFFLLPRSVINCESLDCAQSLSRDNTYFLVVGDFPGVISSNQNQEMMMFDDEWGVLGTPGFILDQGKLPTGFNSYNEILQATFVPAVWIIMMTTAGSLLFAALSCERNLIQVLPYGYGLGLGVFTLLLALISLLGIPITLTSALLLSGMLLVLSAIVDVLRRKKIHRGKEVGIYASAVKRFDGWWLVILIVGLFAMLISVGKGYHTSDEIMLWGVKGYGIAADETIKTITNWGINTLPYPLHVPLLIAGMDSLFGEALPASKMVFSLYFLALLFMIYHYLVNTGVRRMYSGLCTIMVATTPLIFQHATIGYANLTMSYYLVGALLLYSQAERHGSTGLIWLAGIFLAGAAWTRPEASLLAWLCAALIAIRIPRKFHESFYKNKLVALVLPLGLYTLFWFWLKSSVYSLPLGKANLGGYALGEIFLGNLHLGEAVFIFRFFGLSLVDFKVWGLLGAAAIIMVLLGLWFNNLAWNDLVLQAGVLMIGLILGVYYLSSYDPQHDVSWWVIGMKRMILPGILLLWISGASRLKLLDNSDTGYPAPGLKSVD